MAARMAMMAITTSSSISVKTSPHSLHFRPPFSHQRMDEKLGVYPGEIGHCFLLPVEVRGVGQEPGMGSLK